MISWFLNLFKEYQPEGKWTTKRFIERYKKKENENKIKDIKKQMDNTAKWLKKKINNNKKMTNKQLRKLDEEFVKKIYLLVGKHSNWLQNTNRYTRIQKDFRKLYNLPGFSW